MFPPDVNAPVVSFISTVVESKYPAANILPLVVSATELTVSYDVPTTVSINVNVLVISVALANFATYPSEKYCDVPVLLFTFVMSAVPSPSISIDAE